MKTLIKNSFATFLLGFGLFSCVEEEPSYLEPTWKQSLQIETTSSEETRNFIAEVNLSTGEATWAKEQVQINFDSKWINDLQVDISSVELYVNVEETTPAGKKLVSPDGRLLKRIEDFVIGEKQVITISVDEIYNALSSDFTLPRPNKLRSDDLVELKWVVTGADGEKLDGRSECSGEFCQYAFGVSTIADIWSGEFEYEYLVVGNGVQCCTSIPKVNVGTIGTLLITKTGPGKYSIPDAEFGASWNGQPVPADMTFDFASGKVNLTDLANHNVIWTISNINGKTLEIAWKNKWESYGEFGTIKLTRKDDIDWPNNLN